MGNYIKISRDIIHWEWYKDEHTKGLFLHCIIKANWKDCNFKGVKIKRGEFVTSIPVLQDELSLTSNEVRTAIKHLKKTGEITVKPYSKFSVITVVNYDLYQTESHSNNSQITYKQQTSNIQTADKSQSINSLLTTIEEVKNDSKEEVKQENMEECISPPLPPSQGETEEKPKRKRFTPPTIEEVQAYCTERNNDIDAQAFIDFYESKGWMIGKNKMKDWKAAIRTWERGRNQNGREQGSRDILSEWRDS